MQLVAYLGFNRQCEEAFKFYEKVFRGQIVAMIRNGETPAAEHVGPEAKNLIMHARLVADGAVLMGGDHPHPDQYKPPHGFSVSIHVKEPAEAERIFVELAVGGEVQMPMEETFWAYKFAMLTDRYGIPWMINCEKPM